MQPADVLLLTEDCRSNNDRFAYIAAAVANLLIDIVITEDLVHFAQNTRNITMDVNNL